MTENTPSQCQSCQHCFQQEGQARCRKIEVRMEHRQVDEFRNVLTMEPGFCAHLNPHNSCPKYRPTLTHRLRSLFKTD